MRTTVNIEPLILPADMTILRAAWPQVSEQLFNQAIKAGDLGPVVETRFGDMYEVKNIKAWLTRLNEEEANRG